MNKFLPIFLSLMLLPFAAAQANGYSLSPIDEIALSLRETKSLIDEAKRNTDRAERFRFNYQNLISDIAIIHNGLISASSGKEDREHKVRSLFIEYGYVGRTAEAKYLTMLKRELQMLQSKALSLVPDPTNEKPVRSIDFEFLAADLASVVDAITVALAGSGDRPRRFPALGGNNH